jgi:hypothetical protein
MRLKNFTRAAAVAATVALTGGALSASPASASTQWCRWNDDYTVQACFSNDPGSGAESWAWVWAAKANCGQASIYFDNSHKPIALRTYGWGSQNHRDFWKWEGFSDIGAVYASKC